MVFFVFLQFKFNHKGIFSLFSPESGRKRGKNSKNLKAENGNLKMELGLLGYHLSEVRVVGDSVTRCARDVMVVLIV